ncbi:hypothetical protein GGI07_000362 [Coemansia sp. Benny D115]|nr:hypothetical protein GGI07_000362 [Coemansia sp. Benny D115]
MDIQLLLTAVNQCLQPNSSTRQTLGTRLEQLLESTRILKAANVEAISNPQESSSGYPEPTRHAAIKCWRQIANGISTVHVPKMHLQPRKSKATQDGDLKVLESRLVGLGEYIRQYLPEGYLSLVVCGLLDNAEVSDDQNLRILALDTLNDTIGLSGLLGKPEFIAPVFPGVASAAARIALAQAPKSTSKEPVAESNHRKPTAAVRAHALGVMRAAIIAMYGSGSFGADDKGNGYLDLRLAADWALEAKAQIDSIIQSGTSEAEEGSLEMSADSPNTPADKEAGGEHRALLHILWRLSGLRSSEHSQIAVALLELFTCIVTKCASLVTTPCFDVSVEAALVISMRSIQTERSQECISELIDMCNDSDSASAVKLRGRLLKLLERSLPLFEKYICDGTDEQRLDIMCLLSGYLRVLGRAESRSMLEPWWAAHGLQALLSALTVSLPGTSLLITEVASESAGSDEKSSEREMADSVTYVLDRFRSMHLSNSLDELITRIALVISPTLLCSQLLDQLVSYGSASMHSSALWMLTKLISLTAGPKFGFGSGSGHALNSSSIGQSIFQYSMGHFAASDRSSTSKTSSPSQESKAAVVSSDSDHTLHTCILLNAISAVIPTVGPAIAYHMDTLLFPLLQLTTSHTPLIRQQARRALGVMAEASGSISVPEMLNENVDYIVEGCSQQIRSIDLHPDVFGILTGAVRLVGPDILVYMDDVVEDTLDVCENLATAVEGEDADNMCVAALGFLEVVTRTVAGTTESKLLEHGGSGAGSRGRTVGVENADPIGRVLAELDEIKAREQMSEFLDFEEVSTDAAMLPHVQNQLTAAPATEADTMDDDDDPAKEQPGNPLAVKIALVVQNILSAESSSQQLLALKIMQNTLRALVDTKDLLPLVNHTWPPLVHRLAQDHDQFYVTLAACDVIEVVCSLGESWMRSRVKEDLWVHFSHVLQRAKGAHGSSERALVLRVLNTMCTVVDRVPLEESTAWTLACLVLQLIGQNAFHDDALRLLTRMVPLYGDKLWLIAAKLGRAGVDPSSIPALPGVPSTVNLPADICQILGI